MNHPISLHPLTQTTLLGAVIGDMAGSFYEHPPSNRVTKTDFKIYAPGSTFTDDTVMTMAIAQYLIDVKLGQNKPVEFYLKNFFAKYPSRNYGKGFVAWCKGSEDNQSYGNGAAMRISAVAYCASDERSLLDLARKVTIPSHAHPLAIVCAQAVALAIFMSLRQDSKAEIAIAVSQLLAGTGIFPATIKAPEAYDQYYKNEEPISKSFPSVLQAIGCFIFTDSAEAAIRKAVACGKDADTQAAIVGSIAFAFYKQIPRYMFSYAPGLPEEFIDIIETFSELYEVPKIELL